MGGILITTFRAAAGQMDSVNVELLEAGEQRIRDARAVCEFYEPIYQALHSAKRKAESSVAETR